MARDRWTPARRKVADFLASYMEKHGISPSLAEIAAGTGMWKRSVEVALQGLEKMGIVELNRGLSRGIRLLASRPVQVPLLGEVRAGMPMLSQEAPAEYINVDPRLVRFPDPVALRVEGYSMRDAGILPDDIVLIRPQETAEHGQTVIAWLDGGLTVKRFLRQEGKIGLEPANPSYKTTWVTEENEFYILGRVMLVIRDLGGCFDFSVEKVERT